MKLAKEINLLVRESISENMNQDVVDYVLRFINCRHNGDTKEAKIAQQWLQKKLGSKFSEILMKHGDPDAHGNFDKVRTAWEKEVR